MAEANISFRAGFVSFVGRPNVGKSTLTNALVGEKIAITSSKPQTTRRAIRAVVHEPHGQLVIVDTPGLHRPRTLLGERLNALVDETLSGVDVICFCVPADQALGPGDRFINEQLGQYPRAKKVAVVTKVELVPKARLARQLMDVSGLREWDAIIPVSALANDQLDTLKALLIGLCPESKALYGSETLTEESNESRICELVREAVLEGVNDELPHSVAIELDEISERESGGLVDIHMSIVLERDSQKPIVIGRGGQRLKEIGTKARPEIERLLGKRVFLKLHVKVMSDWQRDPKLLNRLGF